MAELFLSAILPVLFDKLTSPELLKFATQEGVRSKLKKLEKTLKMIRALLNDAEQKQLEDEAVKMWLEELQDLAYDAEDILDEYATEALRRKLKIEEHRASTSRARKLIPTCCISCTPTALWSDFSMRSKIDDVTSRLQDLCKQRTELGLVEIAGGRSTASQQRLPTTCLPTETVVYGREDDKARILEMVLMNEPGVANFDVIPIVGMGGIGKTTLAQQVYNDKKVEDFNPKAWVCVSDNFDVLRISKAILEVITSSSCDMKELGAVQNHLKKVLNGKRFLLVLDDVWSRDNDLWERLKAPFLVGAPGSKVIVTTRSTEVALAMRQRKCYNLKILSDEYCWEMFVMHAFNNGETIAIWKLDIIREKVLQKCKGLPLAAKTLGGLLYYKETEDEWMNILNSKIWDLDGKILPVLRLSYYHLPSHLKRCFVYCSILPKDYEFEEKELILLWMAEGLIQQSSNDESYNDMQLEDLGGQYFHNLLSRSIFQKSNRNTCKYIMHDLVNDLAQMVSRKISFRLEDEFESNNRLKLFEKTRYASYICHQFNDKRKFEVFNDAKHYLRTHLPVLQINKWWKGTCYISNHVVSNLLSRFKRLRVLSFQYYYITKLPGSIGGLRFLSYLNLSFSGIRSLPESVNSLCNLQTLLLRNCEKLLKLPDNMGNLINLRHLDILDTFLIEEMPLGVRKWECLRTLSNFIVGRSSGANLNDLEDLKSLCGELHISRLGNVTNFQDTKKVILSDKKDLKVLLLEWESRFDESQVEEVESQDVKVLDMLQPHKNLEKLIIRCYRGRRFSSWVGGGLFLESKITILKLVDCKNCTSLPSLGLLGSLKILTIKGMKGIKSIGSEFYGEHYAKPFQYLETLCFKNLEEWESWNLVNNNDSFPKLQELSIVNCPKLSERLPNNLPSLKKLTIRECQHLMVSLSNLPRLCELKLDKCKKIVCTSSAYSESLKYMILSNILDFSDWSLQEFKKVQSLIISGCEKVIELWQNEIFMEKSCGLHSFISLEKLIFMDCDIQLTNLLEGIKQKNTLVEEMIIERCNSLNFIFRGQILQSLKKLYIENCEKLQSVLDDNKDTCTSSCSSPMFLPHLEKVNTSPCHLEHLSLSGCPSLTCLPLIHQLSAALTSLSISSCSNLTTIHQLSAALTSLSISNCSNLTTLSLAGHLPVALKHLGISCCSELTTLLPKGHLPKTLETLDIQLCEKLESIVDKFHNNNALYQINISYCDKLKSLPEGLDTLTSLLSIHITSCGVLTSFPKGGFPCNNLSVILRRCSKLEALPSGIHTLSYLEIQQCPNIQCSAEDLPTKLTLLSISNHKQCKMLMERGFHSFTSLRWLSIEGRSDGECSQEEEMTFSLPSTLHQLWIVGFRKLKNLSFKEFQDLPSLKSLTIEDCPEVTSLPSLPSSLGQLSIKECPLLKEACKRDKGKEWSKISDIPCVYIDGKFIYDPEEEESEEIKD